jgi:ferredoxin-NADP reductase
VALFKFWSNLLSFLFFAAKIGQSVKLKASGSFHFKMAAEHANKNLVFVAGGIGINPILSMLQDIDIWLRNNESIVDTSKLRVSLIYSGSSRKELIFLEEIEKICRRHEQFHLEVI